VQIPPVERLGCEPVFQAIECLTSRIERGDRITRLATLRTAACSRERCGRVPRAEVMAGRGRERISRLLYVCSHDRIKYRSSSRRRAMIELWGEIKRRDRAWSISKASRASIRCLRPDRAGGPSAPSWSSAEGAFCMNPGMCWSGASSRAQYKAFMVSPPPSPLLARPRSRESLRRIRRLCRKGVAKVRGLEERYAFRIWKDWRKARRPWSACPAWFAGSMSSRSAAMRRRRPLDGPEVKYAWRISSAGVC